MSWTPHNYSNRVYALCVCTCVRIDYIGLNWAPHVLRNNSSTFVCLSVCVYADEDSSYSIDEIIANQMSNKSISLYYGNSPLTPL